MNIQSRMTTIEEVANALRCHPRTVFRKLGGARDGVRWEKVLDRPVSINSVAAAFGTTNRTIRDALTDRDRLLKPHEAALLLDVSMRMFKYHLERGRYQRAVKAGGIVRYSQNAICVQARKKK